MIVNTVNVENSPLGGIFVESMKMFLDPLNEISPGLGWLTASREHKALQSPDVSIQ